ncbi:NAD(P)-dependent oxidoreductase [Clostridium sp. CX1]|uniref:NAD(P)-dependent oxidoreductase n=1 Tax=Clostridium sp. CX1 TaxID=2978346 RepID=UPI0021C06847|nr:NAD(P)-dependent oxidoreductase [Clostridium sp. CX1]MCT8976636.1 NAD(P)-dependent oxidoreductase [Clostridium sp. CX1]
MYENNTEDILCSGIEYTFLSLISDKVKVLIVGGGRAALIKAKTFLKKGCNVSVVAKDFIEEFIELKNKENITLIEGEYNSNHIDKNHLIIIATNCASLNDEIRKDCDKVYKLYIDCSSPKDGLCITPCQRSSKNISFGIHTKAGSPKTSVYVANKVEKYLEDFDNFIEFTACIRNRMKNSSNKKEIMNFICSDDFYFFCERGKEREIFSMFYDLD